MRLSSHVSLPQPKSVKTRKSKHCSNDTLSRLGLRLLLLCCPVPLSTPPLVLLLLHIIFIPFTIREHLNVVILTLCALVTGYLRLMAGEAQLLSPWLVKGTSTHPIFLKTWKGNLFLEEIRSQALDLEDTKYN